MVEINTRPHNDRWQRVLGLTLLVVLGLCYRLHYLVLSDFRPDSDEAVVGLMAKHILEGAAVPTFYYGQHYMGSLEALLTAGVFWIAGLSNVCLKMVPLLFSLILIPCMFSLTVLVRSPRAAWFAAALTALPPGMLVIWSTKARGGFIELMVIGCLALILNVRWIQQEKPGWHLLAAVGAVLGFGWWVNNQIIYFMLVVGYLCLSRSLMMPSPLKSVLKNLGVGLISFLVGGLPYWLYNLENDFVSLEMFHRAGEGNVWLHLQGLIQKAYPILLGARRPWGSFDVFPASTLLVALLYGSIFLLWCLVRRKQLFRMLRFSIDITNPEEIAVLLVVACSLVFVSSSFGHLSMEPRYLLPMYIGCFLLVACCLDRLWSMQASLSAGVAFLFFSFHCASLYWNGVQIPGEPVVLNRDRVSKDHKELVQWLLEKDISWVRTDYWIGHRLAFETHEAVRFVSFGEHRECRVPAYCEKAKDREALRFMPLVLVPDQVQVIRKALEEQGYSFKLARKSRYIILYDIQEQEASLEPLSLETARVEASHGRESLSGLSDKNLHSRWGSGHHQEAGMWIRVTFDSPQDLRAIRYNLGDWPHDFPRELRMELELKNGDMVAVFDPEAYHHIRYLLMGDSVFRFYIHVNDVVAVHLRQEGNDAVFDWSIAELEFFTEGG